MEARGLLYLLGKSPMCALDRRLNGIQNRDPEPVWSRENSSEVRFYTYLSIPDGLYFM
jgi:hypothetical protein